MRVESNVRSKFSDIYTELMFISVIIELAQYADSECCVVSDPANIPPVY